MTTLVNSYSFVFIGSLTIIITACLAWRVFGPLWVGVIVAAILAILITFQLMASTKSDSISSLQEFNSALNSGKPVLLELYSNF